MRSVAETLDEAKAALEEGETTVWEVKEMPTLGIQLASTDLARVIEKARNQGVSEFYLADGTASESAYPGIGFEHNGAFHAAILEPEDEVNGNPGSMFSSIDDEEREERDEIATELLEEYGEYLSEEEKYRLENALDHYRVSRLLRMKERVQKEAEADPELEQEAAEKLASDHRFSHNFNETDTELLLEKYEEFDVDDLRIREVHKQAKGRLKVK
ncbi:hypothetical protein [Natrinema sp. H-ect4]|uniref:hypothetical protein n=1 Tax=Natrinema sp. H-ect4 TaxID=3242699 RepID=UPI0035A8B321